MCCTRSCSPEHFLFVVRGALTTSASHPLRSAHAFRFSAQTSSAAPTHVLEVVLNSGNFLYEHCDVIQSTVYYSVLQYIHKIKSSSLNVLFDWFSFTSSYVVLLLKNFQNKHKRL